MSSQHRGTQSTQARTGRIAGKKTWLLAAGMLLVAAPALAYVMRAGAVIEKMGEQRLQLGLFSMRAEGTLLLEGESARQAAKALGTQAPGERLQLAAELVYKMPGRCRVELKPAGTVAPSVANVNGQLRSAGPGLPVLEALAQYACPLLDQRGGPEAEKAWFGFMRRIGVDTRVVKLGRANGTVAYVVGGKATSTAVSTFWVDKEKFQPVRVVVAGEGGATEVRLSDYGSPVGGEWHPRIIEVRKGEKVLGRFVAEKVEANPKVDDAVF